MTSHCRRVITRRKKNYLIREEPSVYVCVCFFFFLMNISRYYHPCKKFSSCCRSNWIYKLIATLLQYTKPPVLVFICIQCSYLHEIILFFFFSVDLHCKLRILFLFEWTFCFVILLRIFYISLWLRFRNFNKKKQFSEKN